MPIEIEPVDLSNPSIEKVVEALKGGKKMEAIMHFRNTHNVSLAEAEQEVERIAEKLGL